MASVESPPGSSPSLATPAVAGWQPEDSLSREKLADLLARIQEGEAEQGYDSLAAGCSSRVILLRHADIFLRYRRWIRPGLVLDWGCRHAPDSCLLKATETVGEHELHGCDVGENRYERALEYSGLAFRALDHPYRLPYADGMFPTVIASGVLEHVPDDGESLKELYRILEPGGRLIITFLPNSRSYTEWLSRRLGTIHHSRLYARSQLRRMLLHRGFETLELGYHQVIPSLTAKAKRLGRLGRGAVRGVELAYGMNGWLERTWGVRSFATNLWAVAEKRSML